MLFNGSVRFRSHTVVLEDGAFGLQNRPMNVVYNILCQHSGSTLIVFQLSICRPGHVAQQFISKLGDFFCFSPGFFYSFHAVHPLISCRAFLIQSEHAATLLQVLFTMCCWRYALRLSYHELYQMMCIL